MVGPGTGLAPFRGFIQERDLARQQDKTVGDTILYFGCRKKSEDYLYEEVKFIMIVHYLKQLMLIQNIILFNKDK